MSKIRIKNFGPIKAGYLEEDGWLDVKKITLFMGNQGSGKSTVAKLISTMLWLEKALVRGDFREKDLKMYNRFKKHCSYQNIGNYFKDTTSIEYKGKAFFISYQNGNVIVEKNEENGYAFPKIMYVPSERNFVSSVKNVRTLKGLPSTLYTFSEEFINAIETLKEQIELPINRTKFEYQKLNKLSRIVGEDYEIKLSESSSGFQSIVPLYIVTRYLANALGSKTDSTVKEISIEEEKRIRKEIEQILSNPNISDDVKQVSLQVLSSKFIYSAFINVVEEPEQNLFPSSQRHILNSLLEFANMTYENKLLITTHSPYIINYLSIAIQGASLKEKIDAVGKKESLNELNEIVPLKSVSKGSDCAVYQFNEDNGSIKKLSTFEGIPSDANRLNEYLTEGNTLFDQLLEIEQGL